MATIDDIKKLEVQKPKPLAVTQPKKPQLPSQPPQLTMQQMIQQLEGSNKIDDADSERRAQKAQNIAALADGLSAISNLVLAPKTGQGNYQASTPTLSEKMQQRWDAARQEREARRRDYLNMAMRMRGDDNALRRLELQEKQQDRLEKERQQRQQRWEATQANKQQNFETTQANKQQAQEQSQQNFEANLNERRQARQERNTAYVSIAGTDYPVAKARVTQQTYDDLYFSLPQSVRDRYEKDAAHEIKDQNSWKDTPKGYKPLTAKERQAAVAEYLNSGDNAFVRRAKKAFGVTEEQETQEQAAPWLDKEEESTTTAPWLK